jgi:chromate transporter
VLKRPVSKLLLYFLKLGSVRFGGPLALVDSMHTDLVGEGKDFSEQEYRMGIVLAQMAPGPMATQLAAYFGWLAGGFWISLLNTLLFVFPSFVMIVLLAHFYVTNNDSSWIHFLSTGMAPIVVALIIKSGINLFKKTEMTKPSEKFIFFASFLVTIIYKQEVVWVFLFAAFLPSILRARNLNWAIFPGSFNPQLFWDIFKYFVEVGSFVFGSGLVIVPFLYGGVVLEHKWLTESQFIDAIAAGMITPGPIVITVAFIGYIVDGMWGATASALGIFIPGYLFMILSTRYLKGILERNPHAVTSVDGLAIAALGAIFGGATLLVQKNLQTWPQQVGAVVIVILAIRFKKVPDPIWIIIGLLAGWMMAAV